MAEYLSSFDWKPSQDHGSYIKERCGIVKKPVDRQQAVRGLKQAVDASLDLALRDKSLCEDDGFLERFLFARKHDVQESFQLLINHYTYRQKHPELFKNLSAGDEAVAHALADGLPGVLPERDRRGRCVIVMFAANWNTAAYTLTAVYRALLLTLETALATEIQNQANGFVIVVDWTEFSFKQSSNMNPKVLKSMIEGLQDCYPARFKGIHFIAQPWYVETALTVIKPFLKGKTKERIHLHGYNLSTLHEHLTKDILPSDLGGEGPSHNTEEWLAKVLRFSGSGSLQEKPYPVQQSIEKHIGHYHSNHHQHQNHHPLDRKQSQDDPVEKAKIDRGYKKSDAFGFLHNNNNGSKGIEKSLKTELLNGDDDVL